MSGAAVSGFMKEFGLLDSEEHRRRDSRNVPGKGIWACEWRHRRLSSARLPLHVVMKLNSDNCNNCIQCTPAMWGSHSGYNFAKQSIWWMNLLHLCANNRKWVSAYMLWWPCCAPVWSCWSSELLHPEHFRCWLSRCHLRCKRSRPLRVWPSDLIPSLPILCRGGRPTSFSAAACNVSPCVFSTQRIEMRVKNEIEAVEIGNISSVIHPAMSLCRSRPLQPWIPVSFVEQVHMHHRLQSPSCQCHFLFPSFLFLKCFNELDVVSLVTESILLLAQS